MSDFLFVVVFINDYMVCCFERSCGFFLSVCHYGCFCVWCKHSFPSWHSFHCLTHIYKQANRTAHIRFGCDRADKHRFASGGWKGGVMENHKKWIRILRFASIFFIKYFLFFGEYVWFLLQWYVCGNAFPYMVAVLGFLHAETVSEEEIAQQIGLKWYASAWFGVVWCGLLIQIYYKYYMLSGIISFVFLWRRKDVWNEMFLRSWMNLYATIVWIHIVLVRNDKHWIEWNWQQVCEMYYD